MPALRLRRAGALRALLGAATALVVVLPPPALGCDDREIDIPTGSGTITCQSVNTCPETNTYAPVPGCAVAFGSPIQTPGRDLVYTVRLPAGMALDVVAIPTGNWDVALYALSSSDPAEAGTSCIDGVDAAFNGGEEVLRDLVNDGAETDTLYIVIDSASTSSKFGCGTLDVEFRHRLAPEGLGNTCADPLAVTWIDDAATIDVSTCGNANSYDVGSGKCFDAFPDTLSGRDMVLEIVVEDSTAWTATITPTSAWDPAVLVTRACTDFTGDCVAAVDDRRVGEAEQLPLIVNPDGAGTATYYMLIDSWLAPGEPAGCGQLEIALTRMPFGGATGESCETPLDLALGSETVTVAGFTCALGDDLDTGALCVPARGSTMPGRDVVYAVELAPEAWSLSVTPLGDWDVGVGVFSACGTTCITSADDWGPGVAESITSIPNPSPGSTVYVVVDSPVPPGTPGGCGGFELRLREAGTVPTESVTWGALKSRYGSE